MDGVHHQSDLLLRRVFTIEQIAKPYSRNFPILRIRKHNIIPNPFDIDQCIFGETPHVYVTHGIDLPIDDKPVMNPQTREITKHHGIGMMIGIHPDTYASFASFLDLMRRNHDFNIQTVEISFNNEMIRKNN